MIEYPQLVIAIQNAHALRNSTTNEYVVLDWDLHYVAEGSYQLRIIHNDNVVHNRNISLRMIFGETNLTTTQGNFYMTETGGYIQMEDVLPSSEILKMLLRVYVYSNPYYTDGRDLDFCEEDECTAPMPLHEEGEHVICQVCGEYFPALLTETYYVIGTYGEEMMNICAECTGRGHNITNIEGVGECVICSDYYQEDNLSWVTIIGRGECLACSDCTEDFYSCYECGILADSDDLSDSDDGETFCESCFPDNNDQLVESWNYLPDLIFHPTLPVDPLRPLYIGIEIEINWENWKYEDACTEWLQGIKDNHSDIMFVKSDSSVHEGFELVTHPMSPDWALENFPFEVLEFAVDAGADQKHRSTGIHIHIDRGALSTAQLWKILKVHEKQRELCGIIGGRGTNATYADWDNNYACVGERALEIARAKGEAWGGADRYVPINLKNENTIELRYMEGSIAVSDIKKNIEWVQALYDFTDYISVSDVKKGVLDIPGFLLGWIVDQEKIYPNLTGFVLARTMIPLEMPERSNTCA